MTRWRLPVGLILASILYFITACSSSSPDEPTQRACDLLAKAIDDEQYSVYQWVQAGRPDGGSDAVRAAQGALPGLIAQAASEALSAPSDIASSFADAAKNAVTYKQALAQRDTDSAAAAMFGIEVTVKLCRDKGVEMAIRDQTTGELEE